MLTSEIEVHLDPNKQDKESLQTKKAQLEQEAEELENEFQSLKTQVIN